MSSKKTVKAMPKKTLSPKKKVAKAAKTAKQSKTKLAEKVTKEISKNDVKFSLDSAKDSFLLVQENEKGLSMTVSNMTTETVIFISMELNEMLVKKLGLKTSKNTKSKSVN